MLILTRRPGESLAIGDDIRLTVLSVSSGENSSVVLGIDAPRDVLILRSELQQAISVNLDAAQAATSPKTVAALEQVLYHANGKSENIAKKTEESKK